MLAASMNEEMQPGNVNLDSQGDAEPAEPSTAHADGRGLAVGEEPVGSDAASSRDGNCHSGNNNAKVGVQAAATHGLPRRPVSSSSSSRHALSVVAEHEVEWRGRESDELDTSSSQDPSTGSTENASAVATNGHGSVNGSGSGNGDNSGGGMDATSSSSGILRDPSQHHIVWGIVESVEQRGPKTSKQDASETDTSSSSTCTAQQTASPALALGLTGYRAIEPTVLKKMQDRGMDPKDLAFQQLALSGEEDDEDLEDLEDQASDSDQVQDQQELPSVGSADPPHGKGKKTRHCRGKRLRYRRFVRELENAIVAAPDPDNFDLSTINIPPSIATDPKEKRKLQAKIESIVRLRKQAEEADESSPAPAAGQAHPEDAATEPVDDLAVQDRID